MDIETHSEPLTLASLQKLIQNSLAYPYAWEKVGLGDLRGESVESFCRDRAAHIAQEVWDRLQPTEGSTNERVQR